MPQPHTLDTQFSVSRVKRLLDSITPARLNDATFLESIEKELEVFFTYPGFYAALMKAEAVAWLAAASVRKGHALIFHCFCSWGMPIEKVMTLLMTLRPAMVMPMAWSKNFIDLFSDVCAYQWKAAPLAAHLVNFAGKDKIPAVSLKIVFRSAFRKRQLEDLLLAMRVQMPDMNLRVEKALGWLLEDFSEQTARLNTLPMELFTPHLFKASYYQAQPSPEVRQVLWGTELTYDSRIAIGKLALAWERCALAETLGLQTIEDVYRLLKDRFLKLGYMGMLSLLKEQTDINAVLRSAFIQEGVTAVSLAANVPSDLVKILVQAGYLEPILEDQRWRQTGVMPEVNPGITNIGINVDTVV